MSKPTSIIGRDGPTPGRVGLYLNPDGFERSIVHPDEAKWRRHRRRLRGPGGQHHPDVSWLWYPPAVMDGWQVLEEIKADEDLKDTPVVMLTAKVQDQDQIRGWSHGAAEYITKPFSPLSLSQVLQDVLATDPEEEERRRALVLEKLQLLQNS